MLADILLCRAVYIRQPLAIAVQTKTGVHEGGKP